MTKTKSQPYFILMPLGFWQLNSLLGDSLTNCSKGFLKMFVLVELHISISNLFHSVVFIALSPTFSLFAANILNYTQWYMPGMVTWDASVTSQSIFSMFCMCQNIACKSFCSIYFDTVGWCLNLRDICVYCCDFSHWDCILCITAIVIIQKIHPFASLF